MPVYDADAQCMIYTGVKRVDPISAEFPEAIVNGVVNRDALVDSGSESG